MNTESNSVTKANDDPLAALAKQALDGSSAALEQLMAAIRDPIYGLAVRMLLHPQDAEDAAQDIAVRIMTRLGLYRGEGAFMSWAMRVAANFLVNVHKKRNLEQLTFSDVAGELETGWDTVPAPTTNPNAPQRVETRILVEEVKIGCSSAMLLCLDRDKRIAYILGEIFEVTSDQGAFILDISPAAFRKRLSRARELLTAFMKQHCGLVETKNRCSCETRMPIAAARRRLDPDHLLFANHTRCATPTHRQLKQTNHQPQPAVVSRTVREMNAMQKAAAVFRSHPDYRGPDSYMHSVRALVESGKFRAFEV